MRIYDIVHESFSAIATNKVRTGLTMLGIIIGIASVIALVSIGQGAKNSIEERIQSIGSNLIMITPGRQRTPGAMVSTGRGAATTLKMSDSEAIKSELASVQAVSPETSKRYQITVNGKNTNTTVSGVIAEYSQVRNIVMNEGTFISDQNVKSYARVAVLGPLTVTDLFGEGASNVLNKKIKINRVEFRVIGITEAKGGSGPTNQDDMVFIPITTAQRYLSGDENISMIAVQAVSQEVMATLQEDINTLLLGRHNIANPELADFSIMNQADIVATASSVTDTFTVLLAAIASISLLVGGIGIMNMMLTTVTERTHEIGLRKAVGASSRNISVQFLFESVILTFIGGGIGIIFGWMISLLISSFVQISAQISLSAVLMAFTVSALIGIIFGYYPARRAASLSPIEALRYD